MNIFDVSEKARKIRKEGLFTQQEIADKCGISCSRLNLFENGKINEMQFGNVMRILGALGLEFDIIPIVSKSQTLEEIQKENEHEESMYFGQ